MKINIKRFICFLLCGLTTLTGGCSSDSEKNNENKIETKYDYSVEDIKMNGMFDFDTLKERKVVTDVIYSDGLIQGCLLEGEKYEQEKTNKAFYWIGKPKTEMPNGGYPAVLLIHGGGGNAFLDWVKYWNDLGYVALALDINGSMFDEDLNQTVNTEFYCNGSWGSVGCGTDQNSFKKSWTYMNVCNAIFANNILRELNYVNNDYIFATGISWGGFLTCILSGVDKRFCGFAPVYGCGDLFNDSWGLEVAGLKGLTEEKRNDWASVYDPISYLPYSTKPMLFVSGMTDHAFSPISHKASTSLAKGKVFFSYTKTLTHGHYWKQTPCVFAFFEHLRNKTALPVYIDFAKIDNKVLQIALEENVDYASLVYTTSTETDSHQWEWQVDEVTISKGTNSVSIPDNATAVLISLGAKDTENSNNEYIVFSSDIFFINQ